MVSTRSKLDEIVESFSTLEDPRSHINRRHPLPCIPVIAVLAVLAGAAGPHGQRISNRLKSRGFCTDSSEKSGV